MRALALWLGLALALLANLASNGCVKDVCTEASARLELTVSFSGFDLSQARRLELESTVLAPSLDDSIPFYQDVRLGSLVFPSEARSGKARFVFDPGGYVRGLQANSAADIEFEHTLWIRVYGGAAGQPDRLLAEGHRTATLSARGCYLNQTMSVSAAQTCEDKPEGAPCVGSATGPAVCRCLAPGAGCVPTCQESSCGDGYTDLQQGELCEENQLTGLCQWSCIPLPRSITVSADGSDPLGLSGSPMLTGLQGGDPLTHGLHELRFDLTEAPRPGGALLAADLDGDGKDELAIGFSEGLGSTPGSGASGKVIVKNWPLVGAPSFGDPSRDHATFEPSGDSVSWLGASLATGDLDGDGILDLVAGAPIRGQGAGAAYLLHGGIGNAVPPKPASNYILSVDSPSSLGQYQAILGLQATTAELPGDRFGYAVAAADLDGDGLSDLVVSAPGRSTAERDSFGEVYIFRGGDDLGSRLVGNLTELPRVTLQASRPGTRLGVSLATGDLDGDGVSDLIMGSDTSSVTADCGFDHCGGVFVLFGGDHVRAIVETTVDLHAASLEGDPDLLRLTADTSTPSDARDLGGAVAVADLDSDGRGELAVTRGRRGSSVPPSEVVLISGTSFADYRASGAEIDLELDAVRLVGDATASFGAVLGGQDANGDGIQDLLIGAPTANGVDQHRPWLRCGAIYVVLGSPRVDYFASPAIELMQAAAEMSAIGLPLLAVFGSVEDGQLGSAFVASSQFGMTDPLGSVRRLMVLEPGWRPEASPLEQARGRVIGIYLPGLLPCGSEPLCPVPGTP
ncbi:MAG: FG-GAP-like repeat-containing protein [Polyangia bacterium]|jgi:hypothetical protein|nr:FG-GAP-like repeat-containing protein [Polyangia bacterium]